MTDLKKRAILAIIAILAAGLFLFSPASSAPACGNGLCESGESYLACSDCPKPYDYYSSTAKEGFMCITGDKTCTQACGEIGQSCVSRSCSWGGSCGKPDGQPSEWCNSNPTYSGSLCDVPIATTLTSGFCYCGPAPSVTATPEVKPVAVCGNGVCEIGESYLTCSDCPKPVSYYSSTPAPTGPSCEDSDNGLNVYVKGACKDKNAYWYDSCSVDINNNGVSSLAEMYCDYGSDACVENNIPCANGCSDGACIVPPVCGNGVCEAGESYLSCSDCPKPVSYYSSVNEQVKCVFANSENSLQKCYASNGQGCSGVGTCVADVYGAKGTSLTWKSSCGGYAYTTIDGENKYAEFKCEAVCGNGLCESGESYLTCSDCPKPVSYYSSGTTASTLKKLAEDTASIYANSIGNSIIKFNGWEYDKSLASQWWTVFEVNGRELKVETSTPNYLEKCLIGGDFCEVYVGTTYGLKPHYAEVIQSDVTGKLISSVTLSSERTIMYNASACGDGICSGGESYLTCSDCPKPYDYAYSVCGNGRCEAGEDYKSCPIDCQNPFIYPGLSYSIAVLPGWNLISNPLLGVAPEDVLTQLDGNCGDVEGWHYSPKSGYGKPTDFGTKKGYWLKVSGACKVTLTTKAYPKPEPYAVGLETGWNQIGAPSEKTSFESVRGDCDVSKGPYWYDPSTNQYVRAAALEPGKGYFVKVAQPCTLKAGEAGIPPLPE